MTAPIPDRIFLHDHVVEVEIGAFQQERGTLQRIRFNVDVEIAAPDGPLDDDVDRILSYDRITEAIGAELASGRFDLLETLAENVAARILAAPQALAVILRIEKLDRGPFALGVQIRRTRREVAVAQADPIHPRILPAPNGVPEGVTGGTILCPALVSPMQVGDPRVQWQIDLLALDQSAWLLAAADPRISVAATRTEIDWAIRNGGIVAWAPARMLREAALAPDMTDLAGWLMGQFAHAGVSDMAESRVPPLAP